jgi:hypothetical protein
MIVSLIDQTGVEILENSLVVRKDKTRRVGKLQPSSEWRGGTVKVLWGGDSHPVDVLPAAIGARLID